MRDFRDDHGRRWQAALLDASCGSVHLVFSPLAGAQLRRCPSDAGSLAEAMEWLDALDDQSLRALLDSAADWDPAKN